MRTRLTASSSWAEGVSAFILVTLLFFLATRQLQSPAAVPARAPATEFSSGRAMEQLKAVAQRPHPTGSPENARVREYIVSQLTKLGVETDVQTTTSVRANPRRRGLVGAATVSNLVARLRGSANTKAVLLAAHYDSVPTGPGAGDDGAGVVVLLETLRALKAGPPLPDDVIFLFTDSEELGLLGAKAFVDEHPWAKDAAMILNFDNRGACGPSMMFETSPGNERLIREFARAAPHPVTSSLMYEVYKQLPNDTDFSIFKRAGFAGLNFAYAGCWPRYHTMGDSIQNIDERSLQHHGSLALALARHFASLSLPLPAEGDSTYFSLFGFTLFYPKRWALPSGLAVVILFAAVVILGARTERLTLRGISVGVLGWLASAIVAATVPWLVWRGLVATRTVSLLPYGMAYNSELIAIGLLLVALAIVSVIYILCRRRAGAEDLNVAALAWWALLSLATALYAPGGSYVFAWPLLAALVISFSAKTNRSIGARILIPAVPAAIGILLLGSVIVVLISLLATSTLVILIVAATLLAGLLTPQLELMTAPSKWPLPGGAAALGVVLVCMGAATSRFDPGRPKPDSAFYIENADTGEALWASVDRAPDAWTSQFLSGRVERGNLDRLLPLRAPLIESVAPTVRLAAPQATPLDDLTIGDERTLRLWIHSPRQARVVWVEVENAVSIHQARVNGKPTGPTRTKVPGRSWGLYYAGAPPKGFVLDLTIKASAPLVIKVADQSDALPKVPGLSFRPRSDALMPSPWPPFDGTTLVTNTFHFDAPS